LTRPLEQVVKSRRAAVDEAKRTLDAAHAQQASAQKEVVGLLERKHSWSAADLERYMALIRSEHINDQAVQAAKDSVLAADTSLEEARSQLEKKERSQYHEEQIWSDTIRRNSTWVTFGLMGLNIFLLLTSLVIIDPWRRRRLVREIRSALDEQKPVPAPPPAPLDVPLVEAAIDSVVEPAGLPLESLGEAKVSVQKSVQEPVTPISSDAQSPVTEAVAASAEELKSADSPEVSKPSAVEMSQEVETTSPHSENAKPVEYIPSTTSPLSWRDTLPAAIRRSKEYFRDLFSDRHITVRKVDLTAATLEGACAGAILMSLLLVLVRQK
jgi:sensitive to high expression protein 9, mitochondrial